jgi:glycosyltransferase involved in cell wall biosynthesis
MRIAIDGLPLCDPLTGVGHYTLELARHLASSGEDEVLVVSPRAFIPSLAAANNATNLSFIHIRVNPVTRYWWSLGLPGYIRKNQVEIFHGTNFEVPLRGNRPSVVTIHDLSQILYSQTHEPRRARKARQRLPLMTRTATIVITPTEAVRQEVHKHLQVPLNRIVAIAEAARSSFRPLDLKSAATVLEQLQITKPFVLYVGTVEPRKNLLTLVRAFEEVVSDRDLPLRLVMAGRKGWMVDDLFLQVKKSPASERISFTGYLSDHDLCALYSSCALFVYPSLYEGFGLPPLEAMACGAPVIASSIPSISEVVGDAAVLVDPSDGASLAQAIISLLGDEELRKELASKGLQRTAELSWERTAQLTRTVYDQALARIAH